MSTVLPWPTILDGDGNIDPQAVQENLDALARSGSSYGGGSVEERFGRGTVTFAASTSSNVVAVSHGLGRKPSVVVVSSIEGTGVIFTALEADWTDTEFKVSGFSAPGVLTDDINFGWRASA